MTAKPIIDIDVIVERPLLKEVIARLAAIGYVHEGDKGIPDREAFDITDASLKASLPAHHLYVCISGSKPVLDHLLFRDYLRKYPDWARRLSDFKVRLCEQYGNDRQKYIDGKAALVEQITQLAIWDVGG
jgi:GrpB-like predicted nucleotidyltransferase (UPF0157 family)